MRTYLHKSPWWLRLLYPQCLWRIPTKKKEIFLTFDDGPKPGITEFVLDQLEQHDQRATFFCVGSNVRKYPELAQKIITKGHAIGNHTLTHRNGWKTSNKTYIEDINSCNDALKPYITGRNLELFRPPYGRFTRHQLKTISRQYRIVMWDYLIGDFDPEIKPEVCLDKAINAITPGSIVVFHDSNKASGCLRQVLPAYLEHLTAIGYRGLTLDH